MSTAVTFASTFAQFIDDLKGTFPEYAGALTLASSLPAADIKTRFVEVWRTHTSAIAEKDAKIFTDAGLELVPGFVMNKKLWQELSAGTQAAIWKYLSSLLLLAASEQTEVCGIYQVSNTIWKK